MIAFLIGMAVGFCIAVTVVILYLDAGNKELEKTVEDVEAKFEHCSELYTTICGRLADRNVEIARLKDQLFEAHETIKRLEYERDALLDRNTTNEE